MEIICEQRPEFVAFAAQELGVKDFGPCTTIAIADGLEILAIVVYSRYDAGQCEMSIVSTKPTWASRFTLEVLLGYPFNQLKCRRINALCHVENDKAMNLLERLGFKRETNDTGLREYMENGSNVHVYSLLKSEYRGLRNGKRRKG